MPKVSVIIPSSDGYRNGNVPLLLEDLKKQTYQDYELIVIKGVSPLSKAHNDAAKKAKGEILVLIDDDIRLGNEKVIENLVKYLESDKSIGITGVSQQIPPDSNLFQRRYAKEVVRAVFPVVKEVTESDMAGGPGMAMYKELYFKLGGQNEKLVRGEDGEFRFRVQQAGYKIVIVPDSWSYHPVFKNIGELITARFKNGIGAAIDLRNRPDLIYEYSDGLNKLKKPKRGIIYRGVRFAGHLIKTLLKFHFVAFANYISYGFGLVFGYIFKQK